MNLRELASPLNQLEFISMCTGGFPEPFTFGFRACRHLRRQKIRYDVVHDNQSLSYGILGIAGCGYPTVATIHHPITVDRETEIRAAGSWLRRMKVRRWYSFLAMQKRVSRRLSHIITVSECSLKDICREFRINPHHFRVVPNGSIPIIFTPSGKRADNLILVTNSADTLKGLRYLLRRSQPSERTELQVVMSGNQKNGRLNILRSPLS